jgi:hypothetical protein
VSPEAPAVRIREVDSSSQKTSSLARSRLAAADFLAAITLCPSGRTIPGAVSYAANDRISTSVSAGGCTRLIRPRCSALPPPDAPDPRWLGIAHTRYLAVAGSALGAGLARTTLDDARSANLKQGVSIRARPNRSHLSHAQFVPNMPRNCGHSGEIMVSLFLCM